MNGEGGSVSVLMLGIVAVVVVITISLGAIGGYLAAYSQAAAAADAAALAAAPVTFRPFGAAGTARQEAARFAGINGARLVSCRCPPDESWSRREVMVTVARDVDLILFGRRTVTASSRAEFVPVRLLGGE